MLTSQSISAMADHPGMDLAHLKGHIKKPLNAFMLYMKDMRSKVVSECTLKESAAINQILGKRVIASNCTFLLLDILKFLLGKILKYHSTYLHMCFNLETMLLQQEKNGQVFGHLRSSLNVYTRKRERNAHHKHSTINICKPVSSQSKLTNFVSVCYFCHLCVMLACIV